MPAKAKNAKHHIQHYKFFFKSKYYPATVINKLFKVRGNWTDSSGASSNASSSSSHIDFVWLDSKKFRTNPEYSGITAGLANIITPDRSIITRKDKLMSALSKYPAARKYLMPQLNINLSNPSDSTVRLPAFFKPGRVYIFKPVGGWLGAGIQIFTDLASLNKYISSLSSTGHKNWVLQEYITNPLLLTVPPSNSLVAPANYKFHIRHYYVYQPGNKPSYYFEKGAFAIAKQQYVASDWLNKDVHDTHFSNGEIWPDDMNPQLTKSQYSYINSQLAELYRYIDSILNAGCYKNNKHCMHLFGVDIMITDTYQVKLLEINPTPGLDYNLDRLEKPLLEAIFYEIVDKYFKPANPINRPAIQLIKIKPFHIKPRKTKKKHAPNPGSVSKKSKSRFQHITSK